jgi:hypothetical protein
LDNNGNSRTNNSSNKGKAIIAPKVIKKPVEVKKTTVKAPIIKPKVKKPIIKKATPEVTKARIIKKPSQIETNRKISE